MEELAKLKELRGLNPPDVPDRIPLFLPLVSSCWDKVVSAVLGAPPPSFDTQEIGQSLAVDQDEESILSDSYLDCHSSAVDSSTMGSKQTAQSMDKEQKARGTERWDREGYKSGEKDCEKNRDREWECKKSKRGESRHGMDWPHGRSPQPRVSVMGYECMVVMANVRYHVRMWQSFRWLQEEAVVRGEGWGASASPSCNSEEITHTQDVTLFLPLPVFHSTPIAVPHRLSSDPTSFAHLSFDQSRGLLPPVDLGGGEPCPVPSIQVHLFRQAFHLSLVP